MGWERWLPIVVQFGLGAVLAAIGLWCGFKSGYLTAVYREDRRLLWTFGAGFLLLLVFSILFTFVLPYWPANGEAMP